MLEKHNFTILGFSMVVFADRFVHVKTAWPIYPTGECDLIEEIVLGYLTKMKYDS